jgi:hypothetical protein
MVHVYKLIILLLISSGLHAQVVQERNARGADRIIILKDGFRVPIRDTATAPALLNYSGDSSRGGVVYDSTLQKLCFWTGVRWVCLDDAAGPGGSSQWRDTTNGIYYNEGNVGINTVNPEYSLHVAGQSYDTTITKYARAFGTTRLYLGYTGSAIRVRRSSDNAEQDIGFLSSGMLDTASLKTFVGAGDGRVTTLYDQMGGANFVQATAALQPHIIVGGAVQYIGSTPSLRFLWNNARMTNTSIVYSAGQDRNITLSYKVDTLYNFFTALNSASTNYGFHGGASSLYWFDGTVRNFSPAFTFTDPVTVVLDSNIAIANGTSTTPTFTVPAVSGMVLGANNAGSDKVRGRVISITYEPFNFDTTLIIKLGVAYVNDTTITGQVKIRNITNQNNIFGLGVDANGNVKKTQSNIILPDSLAFQKRGRTQRINTVGFQSGYNGFVGTSAAAAAADSANFIWGLRAGNSLTTGYRNIAIGRGAMKTATTGHTNIAIGDSALANGLLTHTNVIAIGQRAGASLANAGVGGGGSNFIAIGTNAARSQVSFGAGSSILAIGNNALENFNSSGTFNANIAIGHNALQSATTGVTNTAIGFNALSSLTTGGSNIGISLGAAQPITTGSRNILVGGLLGLTTGNDNIIFSSTPSANLNNPSNSVYIGSAITGGNFLGTNFTAVGSRAAYTLGNNIVAMGFGASETSANPASYTNNENTTAIGTEAGRYNFSSNVTRTNSTFVGYRSGWTQINSGNHTGSHLTAIGANSMTLQTQGSYNIAIGASINTADSTGSNQLAIGGNGIGWIRSKVNGDLRQFQFNSTVADVTTFTPSVSAEFNGTNGAVLLPRLTTAQRDALTPTAGMILFNTSTSKFQGYDGTTWQDLH